MNSTQKLRVNFPFDNLKRGMFILLLLTLMTYIPLYAQNTSFIQSSFGVQVETRNETSLKGFCDFQVGGSSAQYIAVNPENTNQIFVVYMISLDKNNPSATRRIAYTYSLDAGETWSSTVVPVGNINVDQRLPAISFLPDGKGSGFPLIVGHMDPGTGLQTLLFKEEIQLSGFFDLVYTDTTQFSTTEPIWPKILASRDGSKAWMMVNQQWPDFTTFYTEYDPVSNEFGAFIGPLHDDDENSLLSFGYYGMAQSKSLEKVAMYHIDVEDDLTLSYSESLDSGKTFPDFTPITPYPTVFNGDTIGTYVGCDGVYINEELHLIFSSAKPYFDDIVERWAVDTTGMGIWHWSPSDGFSPVAGPAEMQSLFGPSWDGQGMPNGGNPQANTFPMDYPSIGTDANGNLHCVFQVARPSKAKSEYNYYTLCYTMSDDGGNTWTEPFLIETDTLTDYRYPSVAKHNPPNHVYVVYQEDSEPGSGIRGETSVTEAQLIFAKIIYGTSGVVQRINPFAESFHLYQNYPNPFNPTTTVRYSLTKPAFVQLNIYDMLGRNVKTLVNERQRKGTYQLNLNGKSLASGVYWLRLNAVGEGAQTRKMVLVK